MAIARKPERGRSEPCGDDCPVQRTASLIEGKWTLLIIRDLLTGKKRYSELQRSLGGISPRLLAMRLRALESQHIVKRRVFPTKPPSTEYELTGDGLKLHSLIKEMAIFGAHFRR